MKFKNFSCLPALAMFQVLNNHMASDYCIWQHRCRTLPLLQKILLDSTVLASNYPGKNTTLSWGRGQPSFSVSPVRCAACGLLRAAEVSGKFLEISRGMTVTDSGLLKKMRTKTTLHLKISYRCSHFVPTYVSWLSLLNRNTEEI